MVTDIPTADDFRTYGLRYLNLGWDTAVNVALEIVDMREHSSDYEFEEEFKKAAEPELATALTLVEQGIEFLLKGRIASVSPWLLLSRDADKWPRRCDHQDTPFAEFHTLNAQDLVKVHDTVYAVRLPAQFAQVFRELRRQRNAMMHTIDPRVRASITEIFENVLEAAEVLLTPLTWPNERETFLRTARVGVFGSDDVEFQLAREFVAVRAQLQPAAIERFFGLSRDRRTYVCPVCRHASKYVVIEPSSAVLEPNTPESTQVYCFVCRKTSDVIRLKCVAVNDCKGNVIDVDWDECLMCCRPQG